MLPLFPAAPFLFAKGPLLGYVCAMSVGVSTRRRRWIGPFAGDIDRDFEMTTTISLAAVKTPFVKGCGLIGTRIRLEDYDFKTEIRTVFPREGRIVRQLEALNGVKDWYLLELDQPFEYRGTQHAQVLIRTRRIDTRLGEEEPTSAFVLLIRDPAALDERPFDVKKFDHAGNAMTTNISLPAMGVSKPTKKEKETPCKHCGKQVESERTHCPSCGGRLRRSIKPELVLGAQVGVGVIILVAIAAVIVKTDPSIPAAIKSSSMWYKAPVGILAIIGGWVILDLLMERFSKRP